MLAEWKTLDTQNNSLSTYLKTKNWTQIREATRWIELLGRNRSFIDLNSWPEAISTLSYAVPISHSPWRG